MKFIIEAHATGSWKVEHVIIDLDREQAVQLLALRDQAVAFLKTLPNAEPFGQVRTVFSGIEAVGYNDDLQALLDGACWAELPARVDYETKRSEIHCMEIDSDGDIRLTASDKYTSDELWTEDLNDLLKHLTQ